MARPPNYPVPEMPRMGRRNAIVYPNIETVSSTGAFSPINLLNRSSTDDYASLDPDGILTRELRLDKQHQTRWENRDGAENPPVPTSSINSALNDGWQQIMDRKNEHNKFVDGLGILDHTETSKMQGKLAVFAAKQKARKETGLTDGEPLGAQRVIPWRKMDNGKTTLAEERRKLFASFNMTSFEPPETPKNSQSHLKKGKQNNGQQSNESIASSTKEKSVKNIYANVQPKVNTGMRTILEDDDSNKDWKLQAALVAKILKASNNVPTSKTTKASIKNTPGPGTSKQSKPSTATNNSPKSSHEPKKSHLVNNYPAAESVRNVVDKLPLTIGPRASVKKTFGKSDFDRAELVEEPTTRLFPMSTPHPKLRNDSSAKPAKTSLRNTVMNLQRINVGVASKFAPSKHTPAPIVISDIMGVGTRPKPPPTLTTIQAPPSPFLMSTISVPNQLTPIGFNKKKEVVQMTSNDKKGIRKDTAEGAIGKGVKLPTLKTDDDDDKPDHLKVIPSLGSSANKYNNIYIGLYSGSESDDEGTTSKSKKR